MLIFAWLACGKTDPELVATARSLAAWDRGREKLDAGDAAGALAAFREADEIRPSPLLLAWEARAAAATGDTEGAVATLDRVLAAEPRFAEARYNRAAYLARLGRADAAAEDLKVALEDGAARSLSVLEDPDFQGLLDHPSFSFLPQDALSLGVEPPPPTAFWGAEISLRLRLLGIVQPPVTIAATRATGPIELVTVIEDTVDTSQGLGLDLVWTWRVVGAGDVEIGPLTVTAGRYVASADPVTVVASAPPGKELPPLDPIALLTPSQWLAQVPAASAKVLDGRLVVHAGASDRVTTNPALPPPVRYERRERGIPTDTALRWGAGAVATKIRIVDSRGTVVFEGPPS